MIRRGNNKSFKVLCHPFHMESLLFESLFDSEVSALPCWHVPNADAQEARGDAGVLLIDGRINERHSHLSQHWFSFMVGPYMAFWLWTNVLQSCHQDYNKIAQLQAYKYSLPNDRDMDNRHLGSLLYYFLKCSPFSSCDIIHLCLRISCLSQDLLWLIVYSGNEEYYNLAEVLLLCLETWSC